MTVLVVLVFGSGSPGAHIMHALQHHSEQYDKKYTSLTGRIIYFICSATVAAVDGSPCGGYSSEWQLLCPLRHAEHQKL